MDSSCLGIMGAKVKLEVVVEVVMEVTRKLVLLELEVLLEKVVVSM